MLRQDIAAPEVGERQARGLLRRRAPCNQLTIVIVEML
jgi:hypothetical protein